MIRIRVPALLITAAAFLFVSCGGSSSVATKAAATPPDPQWVSSISQHSNGAISRHSPVRVLFTNDVVSQERVGSDATANIGITPAVKMRATFASRREIVLRAEPAFEPGKDYLVRVHAKGLTGVPADTKPFEFKVKTLDVNFDVQTYGLDVEHDRNELMVLRGAILTSDTEDRERIEKIVTATLDGKTLPIVWTAGEHQHVFTIGNIMRNREEQEVLLQWNGAPLNLKSAGSQSWRIPALNEFAVTQTKAVQVSEQRQIQVRFSDSLDSRQELKGQVRLSKGEFTTSIRNNLLTLYLNEDVVGEVTLTLESAIRSRSGQPLIGTREFKLEFTNTKPQVRFVGKGVILPDATMLSVPFEAVSARAVRVTALQVFAANIPQFLQVNSLDGSRELGRVGRVLWRKTITLASPVPGKWTRYDLDVTELMRKHPGGLFQLTLSLAPADALYDCPDNSETMAPAQFTPLNNEDGDGDDDSHSNWDYYDEQYSSGEINWNERDDPCKPAYYRYGRNLRATRNLLASNIGLIAKRAQRGKLLAVATALDSARPIAGVKIDAMSYQNQVLASGRTDSNGMVELDPRTAPFALIADDGGRKGYLRVANGVALPVSHFDVGGETVVAGLKGFLYGERGVWRPGDTIYLTFALQDRTRTLPPDHPVTVELRNPRGQLVQTQTNAKPVGQFYAFELKTAADAPTGDWNVLALAGGATFAKTIKVETVMPNRLKIELDLGDKAVIESSPLEGTISAQWLSGATAAGLRAAIEVRLSSAPTRFTRNTDYVFDDPARSFAGAPITVFDGELDADGKAKIAKDLVLPRDAPGMLNATFITRVFERGGAFSINRETRTVAAFERYVGLKLPKGDAARDMLLTDKQHGVELATLSADGLPVSVPRLQVSIYKVQWRWWWDSGGESLAQYAQGESTSMVSQETIASKDGRALANFEVKYPEWGRYLVRACDLDGGHCTGRVFYIDWPSWAGAARDQSGPAANILTLTSDKQEYRVGETAVVQLPEASQGRALLTLESGSAILEQRWLEAKPGANRVSIPITAGMAPGIYAAVTMVQPHAGKNNDRPIRLYGVIPLKVIDPQSHLAPQVTTAAEWAPQSKASITVTEKAGRAMDYTLAVVDEGLLGLTGFRTPNLHGEFYKREALGVSTWDLFDEVAGAYGGQLDRLLALGGSDSAAATNPDDGKSRFPPVVRFLGPFSLKANEKRAHVVELPQYVGAVRVMVVAGNGSAYGAADKSVFVRQALMILPTLPRVIGPDETFSLPVSVFTADAAIKSVKLEVQPDSRFSAVSNAATQIAFTRPEEKLGFLTLRSGSQLGKGKIRVIATSGKFRAEHDVWLEVRSPNVPSSRFQRATLAPGESWKGDLTSFGLLGSQLANLEVSALPPINFDGRLEYLIHYPY
ncbi:MAG TPA: MG2 domain-containing protein, partial [Steroidobacteraceae bacterium]|nr:MG2 domain-containing protein [Steroidobacteraceae bacterium]